MDTSKLMSLLDGLESELSSGYEEKLNSLITVYGQARDNPGQDFRGPIDSARQSLEEALLNSSVNDFGPSKREMLRAIGGEDLFGITALDRINAAIAASVTGLPSVVNALEVFRSEITKFRESVTQVTKGLSSLGIRPDTLRPDEFEIGILVPTRLIDGKLSGLTRQLADWNKTLRNLAEVAGEQEREITVRALATGTYELYLVAGAVTARMMITVLNEIAELYKRILEIQVLRKKLAVLHAPVAEAKAIEDHERSELAATITSLVDKIMQESPAKLDKTRANEVRTHLTVSIEKIARFIDKGGDVEVNVAEPEEEEFEATSGAGEKTPEELAAEQQAFDTLQEARLNEYLALQRQGSVIGRLPERSEPILALPEPPEEEEQEPDGGGRHDADSGGKRDRKPRS